MRLASFATHAQSPAITDDDRLAADCLRERGVEILAIPWDAPDVDWDAFEAVVIRSTWDYHLKVDAYAGWVRSFLSRPGRLWNPPRAVLDTLDKRYLIDLARKGVDVVPTEYVEAGAGQELLAVAGRHGWSEIVVKPAVSASARGTWRSSGDSPEGQERFAAQSLVQDVLVQPFCPEVVSSGEWSIVFLGGEYSHAVLKRPGEGDFRVQRHFGGSPLAAVPGARLIEQASAILAEIGGPLLYARVDGIERRGTFLLMEVEVNEPYLFLSFSAEAPARFARALMRLAGA
ncbi:MAG TPA: hypothetical protein VEL75_18435 [Candidatus Methylomirabilis sp.]|nr:hypothetical protein [Candidatus Methylomirabilis sp.]